MTVWKLYMRDRPLARVAEINDYLDFQASLALNDASKWTLRIHGDTDYAQYVNIDLGTGIILYADDVVVLSGPVEELDYEEDENGSILTIRGIDDTGLLAYRNAWPNQVPPWTTAEVDHFEGTAEAAMRHYVNENAVGLAEGGAAFPGHEIPQMYLGAWSNLGPTVRVSTRFDNLMGTLQSIGIQSGLRFRIRQHPTIAGRLEFIVTAPSDRSAHVRFSKALGNIKAVKTTHARPAANLVVVAGQGQGVDRVFAAGVNLPSQQQYGSREYYYDLRQQLTLEEMQAKLTEKMAELGDSWTFEVDVFDDSPFAFLDDWDLGDRVTVQWASQTAIAYIAGVDIALTPEGATVAPTISTLFKATRDDDSFIEAFRRIGHLEQTAEMMTPDQIIELGETVFPPIEHDALHDDRIVSVGTPLWSPIEHDSAHDDRFSQLGHTHGAPAVPSVSGSYTGNGVTTGRQITLGFAPTLVMLQRVSNGNAWRTQRTSDSMFMSDAPSIQIHSTVHLHATDGFVVGDGSTSGNVNTENYDYVAFR